MLAFVWVISSALVLGACKNSDSSAGADTCTGTVDCAEGFVCDEGTCIEDETPPDETNSKDPETKDPSTKDFSTKDPKETEDEGKADYTEACT